MMETLSSEASMSRKNVPTIIYNKGDTHERAAWVALVNTTREILLNVEVHRHDVGSGDRYVGEGHSNKHFESVGPGELIVIDELSSFDLEFNNSYSISYKVNEQDSLITFSIEKYGKFELVEKVAESMVNTLSVIKIKTKKIK
jgi:hypothetical protein